MIFMVFIFYSFYFLRKKMILLLLNLEMMIILLISCFSMLNFSQINFFNWSMIFMTMIVLGASMGLSILVLNMRHLSSDDTKNFNLSLW